MIALVLAGAFAPTFSRQILGGVLASAVFVVAVMWTMGCVARRRKRPPAPMPAETPGGREHGVDLSQYQPESPASEPVAPPPAAQEGGPDHA